MEAGTWFGAFLTRIPACRCINHKPDSGARTFLNELTCPSERELKVLLFYFNFYFLEHKGNISLLSILKRQENIKNIKLSSPPHPRILNMF